MININEKSNIINLTNTDLNSSQYPDIAINGDMIYLAWQSYEEGKDVIRAVVAKREDILNNNFESVVVSKEGNGLMPRLCVHQGVVYLTWSRQNNSIWDIMVSKYDNTWSEPTSVYKGEGAFYPSFASNEEILWLFYTSHDKDKSYIMGTSLKEEVWTQSKIMTDYGSSYRPEAEFIDNDLFLVYDRYLDGTYDIVCGLVEDEEVRSEVILSETDDWATRPVISKEGNKAIVSWYEWGSAATFSYWSSEVICEDGKLEKGNTKKLTGSQNWYNTIDQVSKDNKTYFMYNWGQRRMHLRIRDKGIWSDPLLFTSDDRNFDVRCKANIDNDNNLWVVWQNSEGNGHKQRNAKIVIRAMQLDGLEKSIEKDSEAIHDQFTLPIPAEKELSKHEDDVIKTWRKDSLFSEYELLWGDIHGQSNMSDGLGEIDQYYHSAKSRANLDFTSLTDHDCFPDVITPSEWDLIKFYANANNIENDMTTFVSIEWTPNEYRYDFGHKNIYYRENDGEAIRSTEENGYTPDRVFDSLKNKKALAIPHHPSADWGMVSAATDWSFSNPEHQRLVEIFSRHADFEYDPESISKYTKNISRMKNCSAVDALKRGYRLGFTAGSDSHQMEHGVEGGIVAVYSKKHTRESIFDTLYDRRTFATTGARILMEFSINDFPMGSEIKAKENDTLKLKMRVLGTDTIKELRIMKNGEIYKTFNPDSNEIEMELEETLTSNTDWYYIAVKQKDDHQGWASPIWIDKI